MRQLLIGALSAAVAAVLAGCAATRADQVALCGDERVMIVDMARSSDTALHVIWDWTTAELAGQLPEGKIRQLRPTDECKFVCRNRKFLITSSGNAVLLLDIATKRAEFFADAPMAHSAEMLPGGRVAVALSTTKKGNALEVFDTGRPDKPFFRDTLYSGHGVVWNKHHKRLYTLNYNEIREYKLLDWHSSHPSLRCTRRWPLPLTGGHGLSYVDKDRMLVTGEDKGVRIFHIDTGTFEPFLPLADMPDVKSVNYAPRSGRIVYTVAEESWWTHHVYSKSPDRFITIPSLNIYKARTPR